VDSIVAEASAAVGARLVRAWENVASDIEPVNGRIRATVQTPHQTYVGLTLGLAGRHQLDNAICAMRMLEELPATPAFAMTPAAIRSAVEEVVWPGRLEALDITGIDVIIDGAHNPAGARALAGFLGETFKRPLPIVVGTMRDKDVSGIIAALAPVASCFVMTAASSGRAAGPDELSDVAARVAPGVHAVSRLRPLDAVKTAAGFGAPVVVTGSLHLVGEIRKARA
jgi:dihydrofolate synthase/folylpolyglutamate synthase